MLNFVLILHNTYMKNGFFNVTVEYERYFGDNDTDIKIYIGNNDSLFNGKINRTANRNGTPRIMGKAPLKRWFMTLNLMTQIKVTIIDSNSIRLDV